MKITLYSILVLTLISCGSSIDTENMSAEKLYKEGKELFEEEDYLESQKVFDVIKLQYPASQYADDAQFYLSEIDFARDKFILAAFNYNLLRRIYPTSEYGKQSLFKRSMCYYKLSPSYERDQEYTRKAIESFQEFQYTYSGDSLTLESEKYISELRDKLAHKQFGIAELYSKLDDPKAALVYYNVVINNYDDTSYYEGAYFGKVRALVKMNKVDESKEVYRLYKNEFSDGQYLSEIQTLLNNVDSQ